ncbi:MULTISPECIES: hypothetical protein [unclassified Leifsonia]|uniref:hypothetical protein n=1 Tax=unclassified Leifsonia TaxID=2663824 RepID=UPI0006F4A9A3|nr:MULTISPECIES: hypothetical protein [unclassified Leifsonia]KQX08185.1 hypothetical protein ASC59_11005 [Leifsonia sp. Root1293]KRA12467.1 hypothetical protein ASD61_11005 [Leifsonia sp. Root60]
MTEARTRADGPDGADRPDGAARWRSLIAFGFTLPRRRAGRDLGVLVSWTLLLSLTLLIAIGAPRLAGAVTDASARDAVATAGASADLVVRALVGAPSRSVPVPVIPPDQIAEVAGSLAGNLPPALAAVHRDTTFSVLTPPIATAPVDGSPAPSKRVSLRAGLLTDAASETLALSDGRLPADEPPADAPSAESATADTDAVVIEAIVSEPSARAAGLGVGSRLGLLFAGEVSAQLVIVGITDAQQPGADAGADAAAGARQIPASYAAAAPSGQGTSVGSTVLVTPTGLAASVRAGGEPATATVRVRPDAGAFTGALVDEVALESRRLQLDPSPLLSDSALTIEVRSDFDDVQDAFVVMATTVRAHFTVLTVGILSVAVLVLLIIGGILVRRRAADVALERARGSSLAAVALRAGWEALVLGTAAFAIGIGVAAAIQSSATLELAWPLVVLAVAVLALPVQAVVGAGRQAGGRRAPANRRDRDALQRRKTTGRAVVDISVVVLAVLAMLSLQSRGLMIGGGGIDLIAAAAPVLAAAAVTVLVLRVYRWPVRAVAALTRRARGPWGLLASVRAEGSLAVLPLLALTLAVALLAADATLATTVRSGQEDAAWARVGADARIDGAVTAEIADQVRSSPGVQAASAQFTAPAATIDLGTASSLATVLAVDRHHAELVAVLPALPGIVGSAGADASTDAALFHSLEPSAGEVLPAIVDRGLAERLIGDDITLEIDHQKVPVHVVATIDAGPSGTEAGPFLYVDLAGLAAALADAGSDAGHADTLLVAGPGAAQAARSANVGHVTTRTGWLEHWRDTAAAAGVQAGFGWGIALLAVLALIGFAGWIAGGSRERARSAALLRTVGMPGSVRAWLGLADELPLVIAAVIGGAATGVAIVWMTSSGLGLATLTGGLGAPHPVVPPETAAVLVGGLVAALAVGLGIDALASRQRRSRDVLRAGETI